MGKLSQIHPPRYYGAYEHLANNAQLTPATSKCDRWGKRHGGKTMILPYREDHEWNACRALIAMELNDPVRGSELRRITPLFRGSDEVAISTAEVRRTLSHMLKTPAVLDVTPKGTTVCYSFHSFRRFFATSLGHAKAQREDIQSMCRWLGDEAVEIYNNMKADIQIDFIDRAYSAAPQALSPAVLKKMAAIQLDDDDLYLKWCKFCTVDIEPSFDWPEE